MVGQQTGRFGAVGIAALCPALLVPTPGSQQPVISRAFLHPVTAHRAAVGVQLQHAPTGSTVTVRTDDGHVVGTGKTISGGRALVPVDLPRYEPTSLRVSAQGASERVEVAVRSSEAAVHRSPWIVVNKRVGIGEYTPKQLSDDSSVRLKKPAAERFSTMVKAAARDGVSLWGASSYRSYGDQKRLFDSYVHADGRKDAQAFSAKPGHSEHQTGLAVDVASQKCTVQACFAKTEAGRWVARHAAAYGFVVRYPKDTQGVTGYIYEPWHLRYVGTWLAGYLSSSHTKTLEQAFDLEPANN